MECRSVDYRGEEVKVAKAFSWENIEPSLPDGIGSIPLQEICELGTLDYVMNFERYLLPSDSQVYTKPPRVLVADHSWEQVCKGLMAKGICRLIPESQVYHVQDKPLLSGLFAVSKEEWDGPWEICRLIMNLVPLNKLCRSLGGDISTLPSWAGMSPYILEDSEVLLLSSEDIRCFFYLFSVPASWHRFLAFGRPVPSTLLPQGTRETHYLCSLVLPMGFLNSVSIAQHIHRRIARLSLHGVLPSRGPQNELRKDKPFSSSDWLYRIYLDNYDSLQKTDKHLASQIQGEVSVESLALRQGYQHWGLPRHPKKSVQQATKAEISGAWVDGETGRVKPKAEKVLKYVELALALLKEGRATQKQMQVVCGGFVYCSMFRRALLGLLNRVWTFISEFEFDPPVIKRDLPYQVRLEMIRFIGCVPLAQMSLRSPMRGDVTASDASEYGGGICISNGLSPMGVHAASCQVRGDVPEIEDHIQVLTVGLFDGIGALRVAADVLKLPMGGHISSEVTPEGSRVLESHFPDSVSVGNVELIDEQMVQEWACRFSNVGVVLVGGGPPCQGVSGLNSDRKGALKDARSCLFVHVKRVYQLCKQTFRWAQVHYLMESVQSMDEADRCVMSNHMGSIPYAIDSEGIAICRRPRLYWISWELCSGAGVTIRSPQGTGMSAFTTVELTADIDPTHYLMAGCGKRMNHCQPSLRPGLGSAQAIDPLDSGSASLGRSNDGLQMTIVFLRMSIVTKIAW